MIHDIKIYIWEEAPDFKHLGSHGGNEDFVITIPKTTYDRSYNAQDKMETIVKALTVSKYKYFEYEIDGIVFLCWVTAHA